MKLELMTKNPGPGWACSLSPAQLDISFEKAFKQRRYPDAYERLLMDVPYAAIATLFMRRDEVEAAWAWVGRRCIDRLGKTGREIAAFVSRRGAGGRRPPLR